MSEPTLTLRRADERTVEYVERLLAENDLPRADVQSKPECFYVGYDGDDRVCVGGLELRGTAGLLRSVVVERTARGVGYGAAICEALENEARDVGVETLYLLTTTAQAFFADRGYVAVERSDAPAPIRTTSEFADLCPSTATCMKKSL